MFYRLFVVWVLFIGFCRWSIFGDSGVGDVFCVFGFGGIVYIGFVCVSILEEIKGGCSKNFVFSFGEGVVFGDGE